jgi:agmatinase
VSDFDADGPALLNSGPYGLPNVEADAHVVIIPVPFEATVSYGAGTAQGPEVIVECSRQVDLLDGDFGAVYAPGIAMVDAPVWMNEANEHARTDAVAAIDAQVRGADPAQWLHLAERVDVVSKQVNQWVHEQTARVLAAGKLPVVVGGDHSVPEGSLRACAQSLGDAPLGVLHLDAHCDLRVAYEGFTHSHASIMHNALLANANIRLVQVGIRDFSLGELEAVRNSNGRVVTYFDAQLRTARLSGRFQHVCERIVAQLPHHVYLSFDIDGLDPALCPGTGTPVPGGLSFDEIVCLLHAVVAAGKKVVGLDLVEVAPIEGDDTDGNVAARLLYKMIGCALRSRGAIPAFRLPAVDGIDG